MELGSDRAKEFIEQAFSSGSLADLTLLLSDQEFRRYQGFVYVKPEILKYSKTYIYFKNILVLAIRICQ